MRYQTCRWIRAFLLIIAGLGSTQADGAVRCFCNLSECKDTGFTCRSTLGRCFSQLARSPSVTTETRHGCIESLPPEDMTSCSSDGDIIKTRKYPEGDNKWPVLMCCKSPMCNYYGRIDDNGRDLYEGIDLGFLDDKSSTTERYDPSEDLESTEDSSSVFFRIVVILIPIATISILAGLIFVAVRWMKDDNRRRRHRVLREEALARVKLYVEDHFQRPHCYIADEYQVKDTQAGHAPAQKSASSQCAHSPAVRHAEVQAYGPTVFQACSCHHAVTFTPHAHAHANNALENNSHDPPQLARVHACRKSSDVARTDKMVPASTSAKCDSAFLLAHTDDGTDVSVA